MIVLGCAGMADLCAGISAELGVPVIDGVAAATLMVQSLVTLGCEPARAESSRLPCPRSTPDCSRVSAADGQKDGGVLVMRNRAGSAASLNHRCGTVAG